MTFDHRSSAVGVAASPSANVATSRPSRATDGTVEAFDAERALGTIVDVDGERYLFHAIEIADGSRQITAGTPVTFEPFPRYGALQAARVSPHRSAGHS